MTVTYFKNIYEIIYNNKMYMPTYFCDFNDQNALINTL